MKHALVLGALLLLCACPESHDVIPRDAAEETPEAGPPPDDASVEPDSGVAAPVRPLPRPPQGLQRPPRDGKLPAELRPPEAR